MNPEQATAFQNQLVEQRTALLAQIAQQRGGVIGRAEAAANHFSGAEDSHAQVTTERDIEFALGEHETAELRDINAALERIANGTYGTCSDCGIQIPGERLQAAPSATRCIQCQQEHESPHR